MYECVHQNIMNVRASKECEWKTSGWYVISILDGVAAVGGLCTTP